MANQEGYTSTTTPSGRALEGADFCEHCSHEDMSKVVGFFHESDSFGYVSVYVVCEDCRKEVQEEIDSSQVCCAYCKSSFMKKDTYEWRWYDFHAPQGDEPVIVCKGCNTSPEHRDRVARDQANYEAEFGYQDDQDDIGHDDDDDLDHLGEDPEREEEEEDFDEEEEESR